jgi:hypothetical protein
MAGTYLVEQGHSTLGYMNGPSHAVYAGVRRPRFRREAGLEVLRIRSFLHVRSAMRPDLALYIA